MNTAAFLKFPEAGTWNPVFTREQQKYIAATVRPVEQVAGMIARAYVDQAKAGGYVKANLELQQVARHFFRAELNLSWNDEQLSQWCESRAKKATPWLRAAQATDNPGVLDELVQQGQALCARYGIDAPDVEEHGPLPTLARLADAKWWRLKARRLQAAEVERIAILLGRVRKGREIYCSDETVRRRSAQRHRNRKYLENTTAENITANLKAGERKTYTLAELADLSNSNPRIRRVELMVRVRGFDEVAQLLHHKRDFWTMTTPSRFHRWTTVGSKKNQKVVRENPRWDGSTPRDAQEWLCTVWSRIRSALDKCGIRLYGFRVVEAHHDGTPHWHAAMFYSPHWQRAVAWDEDGNVTAWEDDETRAAAPRVRAIVRRYMISEEMTPRRQKLRAARYWVGKQARANEKAGHAVTFAKQEGSTHANRMRACRLVQASQQADTMATRALVELAEEMKKGRAIKEAKAHRCDFKDIDPNKGDAAGYLAKYITKAIASDEAGELVQQDLYGYDAGDSARRVDAWASANRVRQFQQIGGPSVTAWRELRRAMGSDITQADLFDAPCRIQAAAAAADESDWQAFVLLMGGPMVRRDEQQARIGYWHEHTADGEVVGNPFNRYGEPAKERIYGLSFSQGEGHIFTRANTWKVGQAGQKVEVETSDEIMKATTKTMREVDASTEWKPWAFDFLELDAGLEIGAGFRFSGGAAAPPLESCQ